MYALLCLVFGGLPVCAQQKTICIDPGHISEVGAGTTSAQISELEANWRVAQKLRSELLSRGYTVVMTKKSIDDVVRNKRRAEIANEAHASLMVRLHCDATTGRGMTLYYPDRQGRQGGTTGPTARVIAESKRIAAKMSTVLSQSLKGLLPVHPVKTDRQTLIGSRQGALTGSIYSQVPVVLIEMVNLKNSQDSKFIASELGQWAIAQAIAKAVDGSL
ncbi:MAG: hypothetical protein AUJ92_11865 [Armatimonadetes bacterium CG2_30_59_28]|nr:MAG: hypothetical protein AUJ92_11865 [Armatimonadetes bacterium CG2_30_59_28]PIU64067.1 MAG: hypothetical protein COS85_13795 [Armatimonadetes bacterium CG07_land_8_20_14_0_80_59_28]PIX42143.1 MAG: hypothetical protein COZ56_10085 [Armatimonadetes bacterium CG_4_8_14_3_um_filter_58_9]